MSNSPLVSYTKISPNKTSPRNHEIDTITIHCAVGQISVETLGNIFAPFARQASSNYGVGADGRIGMYCEEKDRSWCSSNGTNDHRAITIEVACDTTYPYAVKDNVYESLIQLVADICKRNNIKELKWKADKSLIGHPELQNMTAHRWFSATSCPGDYLYERFGDIATRVNAIIAPPAQTEESEEEMTQEKFNEMMNNYLIQLAEQKETWGSDNLQWAINNGIIIGDENGRAMPNKFLTRLEGITMIRRLYELIKKK